VRAGPDVTTSQHVGLRQSLQELIGISNLQYSYVPVMPDLYLPFNELQPLLDQTLEPATVLAIRKQRRKQRK